MNNHPFFYWIAFFTPTWYNPAVSHTKEKVIMNGATVTINIPAPAWERLVQTAGGQERAARELLIRLIQDFTRSEEDGGEAGFYAQLTRRYLQGTLKRTASVNAFHLGNQVAAAVQDSYGTSDPVNIIEQARTRQ